VNTPGQEFVEVFLQEASEHLQFLREYAGLLQDPYPLPEDIERLYVAAHTLKGSSAMYGYPHFSEVSAKLAHIFQYAMNATISPEASAPLVEFISEGVAVLESDLWMIASNNHEALEEIEAFRQRYPFAFQAAGATHKSEGEHAESHRSEPEYAADSHVEAAAPVRSTMPARVPPVVDEEPIRYEAPAFSSDDVLGLDVAAPQAPIADQSFTGAPVEQVAPASQEPQPYEQAMPSYAAQLGEQTAPSSGQAAARSAQPVAPAATAPQAEALEPVEVELPAEEELPAEILEFFVPEVEEHLQTVTDCLLALEANPNPEDIHRLFRSMHTIKGSAAQVGLPRISTVAHKAEDLIGRLRDGELKPNARIVDLCLETADAIKKFLYKQWPDEATMRASVTSLITRIVHFSPDSEPATPVAPAVEAKQIAQELAAQIAASAPQEAADADAHKEPEESELVLGLRKQPAGIPQSKSVRIALERLDRMMNAVGELVINRTRMLGRVAELERLADVLNFSKARMSDKITEFQEKYEFSRLTGSGSSQFGAPFAAPPQPISDSGSFPFRGGYSSYSQKFDQSLAEFSELEMDRYDEFNILSRSLTEISADITEILTQLDGFVRRVDGDIDEFTKLAHRLQDEITQARMVPIGNLYTRITRTVRDAAKAANKNVELTLAGDNTELDNNIIQQIADPLLHLVRNSVAHGIEGPEERYETGKPDNGNISVRAYHRGNHIYIEVEDDGRGLDYEKIRTSAVQLGFISEERAAELPEHELLEFLFQPGFSTSPRKTELAGRGVGLDVVRTNLSALNGEIEIETQKGCGTRFTLKVPLTLIISQALFVRCGKDTFAFPLAFVEEIRRLREEEMEEIGGKLITKVRDVVTEVVRLDQQLGLERVQPVNGFYRLVIVNVAGRQVGIVVEEVIRKDEIVIKNLGEYLRNVKLFPGATIAPDGSLILLVDVNRLIAGESIERRPLMTSANAARIFFPGSTAVALGEIPEAATEAVPAEKVVVLADDSISVRKFVGRMLEKAGYRVRLAGDGLEALEIASQTACDLVVTDLEMPRTNGYELLAHLKQSPETRNVPVMVVTSRAGAKHRDKALLQGAADFLVKPVQEETFIAAVARLIGTARGPAVKHVGVAAGK
jgi:chemosensory pili system protein ChpA (sensor histidine kinase/response regulator)